MVSDHTTMIHKTPHIAAGYRKFILFIIIIISLSSYQSRACEILIEVTKNKKEVYNIGDTLIIKVTVILTHRICPEGIKNTKFQSSGIKVIGAKEWNEIQMGVYERELKITVTGTESGKISITAVRKCEKEGGHATLELKSVPLKN